MKNTQENFADLLEEYLDIKAINEKKEYDDEEIAKEEKKQAILRGFAEDNTITIYSFLRDYLHTRTTGELDMTLTTLKYLGLPSSYVMGVHENFAKNNPELVHQGFLVMVKDPNHNRGTYINPIFIENLLNSEKLEIKLQKFSSLRNATLDDLSDYFDEYQNLLEEKENNEKTYDIIKKTHKQKKFIKLKEIKEMSDKND